MPLRSWWMALARQRSRRVAQCAGEVERAGEQQPAGQVGRLGLPGRGLVGGRGLLDPSGQEHQQQQPGGQGWHPKIVRYRNVFGWVSGCLVTDVGAGAVAGAAAGRPARRAETGAGSGRSRPPRTTPQWIATTQSGPTGFARPAPRPRRRPDQSSQNDEEVKQTMTVQPDHSLRPVRASGFPEFDGRPIWCCALREARER